MHARYDLMQAAMLLIIVIGILFALCSFQYSQMAMAADDETEYSVCSGLKF